MPTFPWNGTQLPDWNKITFGSMPALKEAGSLSVDRGSVESLGFDPSRSWAAGTSLDKVFNLGDFQDSLKIQTLNLENISQIAGTNLDSLKLSDFGLLRSQNLASLVKAVPNLAEFPIAQIKPVLDLLKTSLNFQQLQQFNPQQTLGSFLKQSPHLGSLPVSSLPLQNYDLKSIPNLEKTPLGTLERWQAGEIGGIPGLKDVPLSKLPGGISPAGTTVGTADIVFGTKEENRTRTMSGSDVEGFAVYYLGPIPWQAYEEKFSDVFLGAVDPASGGSGGPSTPTGAAPPSTQKRSGNSTGNGGNLNASGDRPNLDVSGDRPNLDASGDRPNLDASGAGRSSHKSDPISSAGAGVYRGISLDALGSSLQGVEGNFTEVGKRTCDASGNCGSSLGAYGFMSYRPDVRSAISARSGGSEVLSKLDKGEAVAPDLLGEVFPPEAQKELFEVAAKRSIDSALSQTDPQTGQPFEGQRAIERIGQMHFGGSAIPVDFPASDIRGYYSVSGYGKKVADSYQSFSSRR